MKKKLLAVLLAACMVAAMLVPASAATTFDDVAEDAWYAGSVERWTNYGILDGMGDNKFDPEGGMTRAQFAKVIVELLGLDHESTDMPFDDVLDTNEGWAAGHIAAAYNAGIINGMGDGKFAPGDDVTFDQSAAMLARATGLVDKDAWGAPVTEKLEELGMLDENVNADADATRALVAALADNMIGKYITADTIEAETEDGVITEDVKGVILVVGGEDLKVEVKDAKVSAIVVQGGEVALTGETTVASVKVSGENATVTAAEGTKIESVTVDGTDAKVELNGEVESVTVAKDATVAELGGTGVSKDKVTNESANEITVNDETVDAAPAEENPDDNQGDDDKQGGTEITNGVVPTPTGYTVPDATSGEYTAPTDSSKKECGSGVEGAAASHTWGDLVETTAAKCTAAGSGKYTCATCGATSTVELPATDHKWVNVTPTGYTTGIACDNGANCNGTKKNIGGENKCWQVEPVQVGGSTGPAAHTHTAADGAEWVKTDASKHWKACKDNDGGKVDEADHNWGTTNNGWTVTNAVGKRTCGDCGREETCNHTDVAAGSKCGTCGYDVPAASTD